MITLVIGGARSGKSRHALTSALAFKGDRFFVATAEPTDDEMQARIHTHQRERDASWTTIECPVDLTSMLRKLDKPGAVVVVDCLTVWLGNLMHYAYDIDSEINELCAVLTASKMQALLVSNEVGQGVVPETESGREFRDIQGRLNQRVAALADKVELVVAGIPITVKG